MNKVIKNLFEHLPFYYLFQKHQNVPLGRWSINKSNSHVMLDVTRACEDHCGDQVCGMPNKNGYKNEPSK